MPANIDTTVDIVKADLHALADTIREHHDHVVGAVRSALEHAMAAGDALIVARQKVNHGEWASWLQRKCNLNERTARRYVQLAEARALIEANRSRATDLTIAGALRLLGNKTPGGNKTKSTKATAPLSSLAWSNATPEQQRQFVDAIGLISWLATMPPSWRPELERRIDGQRAAAAANIDQTLSKALRQALSLQKTATDKDNTSASVAAALNAILNKLKATGLDLNDLEITTRAAPSKQRRAA